MQLTARTNPIYIVCEGTFNWTCILILSFILVGHSKSLAMVSSTENLSSTMYLGQGQSDMYVLMITSIPNSLKVG